MSITQTLRWCWSRLGYVVLTVVFLFCSSISPASWAQTEQSEYVRLVRKIKTWKLGFPNPAGLAFSPRANAFVIMEASRAGKSGNSAASLILMSPVRELLGSVNLTNLTVNPANMVFDGKEQRLLLLDSASNQLLEIKAGADGLPEPAVLTRFDAGQFALQDPEGMALDSGGNLVILDSSALRLVRISPGSDKGFDGKAAAQEGRIARVSLGNVGPGNLRGLAFNPANGNLFLLSRARQMLYELTSSGVVVSARDLSDVVKLWDPQNMVFAPSGDQTDDPEQLSLYVADSGPTFKPRYGKIVELSLTQTAQIYTAAAKQHTSNRLTSTMPGMLQQAQIDATAATEQTSLVRFTDMAAWATPSTDPSDIAYLPASNTLLVADAEIEEYLQPWWHGGNLFETDLAGNLFRLATTTLDGARTDTVPSPPADGSDTTPGNFSNEPCGAVFHKLTDGSNHLLFSDDDACRVHHVDLGTDGRYGGGDDRVNKLFDTRPCGSTDPEGLTFDTLRNHIMMVDGINSEIYDIAPGPNGVFDGCVSGSDDVVTHFDTSTIPGAHDLEGIDFDRDTGHIYVTGNDTAFDRSVVELTVTGDVVRRFHVPAIQAPAGLTIGPGSVDPTIKSLYIVDRGVDNDSVPNENDGRMFEISLSPTPLDKIFADGFESGNIKAWNYNSPTDNGLLSVTAAAAMVGTKGLQITIADTTALYVDDEWPDAESYYRARFYFNPNSIAMASGDAHYIFQGYMIDSVGSASVMRVEFRFSGGSYQLRTGAVDNAGNFTSSPWSTISNGPHRLDVEWQAASAAGTRDGYLKFSIDGVQVGSLTGLDNDTRRMDRARMGAVTGLDAATLGTYYFDQFESYRVSQANRAPVAGNDTYTAQKNTVLNVSAPGVLANDTDADGNPLTALLNVGPTHGTLTLNTNGSLTYTPSTNYAGSDSFTYHASDGTLSSNVATVSITVRAVNQAPVANAQSVTTAEDTAKGITLTASDADGDTLTYSVVTPPVHGTLSGTAPNVTYTPALNYNGSDSFTFKVNDGQVDSASATVSITVTPVNDAPVANAQSVTTAENTAKAITLAASDVDGDTLTYGVVTPPAHGALSGTAPNLTYTPAANYNGSDSFAFKVNDGKVDSNVATVLITVTQVNQAPTVYAGPDQTVTLPPGSATLNGSASDDGLPNPPGALTVTWSKVSGPGTVTFGNIHALSTTATFSRTGSYTLRLTANDGALSSRDDVAVNVRKK